MKLDLPKLPYTSKNLDESLVRITKIPLLAREGKTKLILSACEEIVLGKDLDPIDVARVRAALQDIKETGEFRFSDENLVVEETERFLQILKEEAANDESQFNVVITYGTKADSAEEAVELALTAIDDRNGAYVEVFQGLNRSTAWEGELSEIVITAPTKGM